MYLTRFTSIQIQCHSFKDRHSLNLLRDSRKEDHQRWPSRYELSMTSQNWLLKISIRWRTLFVKDGNRYCTYLSNASSSAQQFQPRRKKTRRAFDVFAAWSKRHVVLLEETPSDTSVINVQAQADVRLLCLCADLQIHWSTLTRINTHWFQACPLFEYQFMRTTSLQGLQKKMSGVLCSDTSSSTPEAWEMCCLFCGPETAGWAMIMKN